MLGGCIFGMAKSIVRHKGCKSVVSARLVLCGRRWGTLKTVGLLDLSSMLCFSIVARWRALVCSFVSCIVLRKHLIVLQFFGCLGLEMTD